MIQRQLALGNADDPLEHEADRLADQVMRSPDPAVTPAHSSVRLRRKCAACEDEQKRLQRASRSETGKQNTDTVPDIVGEALRQPGQPLDPPTRVFMEARLQHDFTGVRVHDDALAWASARSVDALAYTVGNRIVFRQGQYRPHSEAGRRLIAHELAHTIQQRSVLPAKDGLVMRQPAANPPHYGASCSGGANDPCQPARCTPNHSKTAVADIARAIGYVNAAIAALSAAPLAGDTMRALHWFFADTDPATANEVKRRLGCILGCLTDTQTNNRFACHPDDPNLAYVCVGHTAICAQALTNVCLTDKHFGTDERERAETVIHECAHRVGMSLGTPTSVPDIYRFTARFLNLSTADALQNSDSFALFAGSISEGVRVSVLPVFAAAGGAAGPTGGAPATWLARLYLGAEFQHPALSIFNPTLGLGFTLIGNPDTPSPGAPPSTTTLTSALLGGVRIANPRPGGAGAPYLSLFGGPSVVVDSGSTKLGAEAGIGVGYRWRFLDVSVGAGYIYDPVRASGSRDILTGYVGLGIIPLF